VKNIKTEYRIYRNNGVKLNASIFDFIDGDFETKQTKAFSYILKNYPDIIKILFNFIPIINNQKYDEVRIDAELRTEHKKRSDILIRMYRNKIPIVALIIEAKSIKTGVTKIDSIEKQLEEYFNDSVLNEFNGKKHGIVLTKYELVSDKFSCITWNKLITDLNYYYSKKPKSNLVNEFTDYLIKINNTMEYYEKEVASIPAQHTIENVEKYSIYHRPTDMDAIKKSIYVTFRKDKGRMEKLYKVKRILTLSPSYIDGIRKNNSCEDMEIEKLEKTDFENLRAYIRNSLTEEIKSDYNFYVLDTKHNINLINRNNIFPRPERNNLGYWYYSLSELLSEKEIVMVDSKSK